MYSDDLLRSSERWDAQQTAAFPGILQVEQSLEKYLPQKTWETMQNIHRGKIRPLPSGPVTTRGERDKGQSKISAFCKEKLTEAGGKQQADNNQKSPMIIRPGGMPPTLIPSKPVKILRGRDIVVIRASGYEWIHTGIHCSENKFTNSSRATSARSRREVKSSIIDPGSKTISPPRSIRRCSA